MWLIYLLFMLDNLSYLTCTLSVLSGLATIALIVMSAIAKSQDGDRYYDYSKKQIDIIVKGRKIALAIFIPSILITLFVPNSKQAALIFTIGSTLEYVQGNEKLQELPDKAVECLDKFIDEYLNDTKQ